jgi:hypothetical protein
MALTQAEVSAVLAPYHSLIREVVDEAWAEWASIQSFRSDSRLPPVLYTRTICNLVFDGIARRGILRFGALDSVRVEIEPQTFKLHFRGVTARFKKGGDDKLGRNVTTQAVLAFIEADGILPGLPPETAKVEFVWLPNEIWTAVDRVLVVARDGDRLIWEYDIERGGPKAQVVELPLKPLASGSPAAPPLIAPKPIAKPDDKSK